MASNNTDSILNLLEKPLQNPQNKPILVKVIGGDTVSQIVSKYYDTQLGSKTYQLALAQLKRHNPKINNVNQIQIGQVLKLMPIPSAQAIKQVELPKQFDPLQIPIDTRPFNCYVCSPYVPLNVNQIALHMPNKPKELEAFLLASWFEDNWFSLTSGGTSSILSGISTTTGAHNMALMLEVKSAYEDMKAGRITRASYDYKRRKALQTLSKKLGKAEKLFFKGKTAQEAVRISRVKGIPATDHVLRNASRFSKISKIAGAGGSIVLAGASLAYACHEIGETQNQQEQNEIMVDTVGSIGSGLIIGAVSLALITGPVGIGFALLIGGTSALVSFGIGKGAKEVYRRTDLKKVDLVGATGVRGWCE